MKKDVLIVAGVALAALGLAWYVKQKAGDVAAAVAPLVNPLDERNLAYTSTNSFLGLLTGRQNFDLGYAAYDGVQWLDGKRVVAGDAIGSGVYDGVQYVDGKRVAVGDAIGSGIYDGVDWLKGLFK